MPLNRIYWLRRRKRTSSRKTAPVSAHRSPHVYVIIATRKFSRPPPHSYGISQMEENRKKALAAALGQIEKQYGKGSGMRVGDAAAHYDEESAARGSPP